jgi:hypothetical protein
MSYKISITPWTPRSKVLLDKLPGSQLVMKFLAFYEIRRFITAFTSARHLSLSSARSMQSMPPHPISYTSTLILFSNLRLGLPSRLCPSGFPTKTLYSPLFSPHTCYVPRLSILELITRVILKASITNFKIWFGWNSPEFCKCGSIIALSFYCSLCAPVKVKTQDTEGLD